MSPTSTLGNVPHGWVMVSSSVRSSTTFMLAEQRELAAELGAGLVGLEVQVCTASAFKRRAVVEGDVRADLDGPHGGVGVAGDRLGQVRHDLAAGVVRGERIEDGAGDVVAAVGPRVDRGVVAAGLALDADDERAAADRHHLGVGGGGRVGEHRRGSVTARGARPCSRPAVGVASRSASLPPQAATTAASERDARRCDAVDRVNGLRMV